MTKGTDAAAAEQAALASNAPDAAVAAGATPAPEALSESDQLQLQRARHACEADDFNEFFFVVTHSQAVRAHSIAAELDVGAQGDGRRQSRAAYLAAGGFPLQALDYQIFTAASVALPDRPGRSELEPIVWAVNTAADGRRAVEWSSADFAGGAEEGPGAIIRLKQPNGILLFRPTGDCWELFSDERNTNVDETTIRRRYSGNQE